MSQESNRISELRRYAILDTPPEARFDRITSLAARIFKTPIALISLVDEQRQWFKSHYGTAVRQTAREISFCTHAIEGDQVLVVPDATLDPRFAASPLVTGEPHIRFYAGAPLITAAGYRLGTLCLIDRAARDPLTPDQEANLTDLAAMVVDQLELRLAEGERTEAQKLLASVFESAAGGISVTDERGCYVQINPAYCRLLGYEASNLIGRPFYDFLEPAGEAAAAHAGFMAGESEMPAHWRMRRKDGAIIDVYVSSSRLVLDDGRRFRVASVTDVTPLKQAEEALRESHRRVTRILESITDAFFTVDKDWRFVYLNAEAERMIGGNLVGTSLYDRFPKGEENRFAPRYEEAMKWQTPVHFEEFSPRMNAWLEVHVYPSPDSCSVYLRDVTQPHKGQQQLAQLASIIEFSDDAIVGMTVDGAITSWNADAGRIYGYAAEEMIGKSVSILAPLARAGEVAEFYEALERGERSQAVETTRVRKDGRQVPVSLTLSAIRDTHGGIIGISSIARDITERKRLEEQLLHSQKMEAVALLAGGVAHDFNNLLTVILGYCRLLLVELEGDTPAREYAEEVLQAAERASALTSQLLAFSRRQVSQPRVVDLNEAVRSMDKILRRTLGEDIELVTVRGENLGYVKVDPGQMEQMIANLALNARDAMPKGGKLTIETANVVLDDAYRRQHPQVRPGPYVMLAVSDTGSGMPQDVQRRMFEPFFTTKSQGKGTGLGLSIIHGIVKQSGGEIWVYSEPEKGTTIKVYLPRVACEQAAAKPQAREEIPRGSETVLLVEDETPVRKLVSTMLRRQGYTVLAAGDGSEAIGICNSHEGRIHVLVTDVVMPGMAGPDLAHAVGLLRPNLKVLFMSGYTDRAAVRHKMIEADANFLQKPFCGATTRGRRASPMPLSRCGRFCSPAAARKPAGPPDLPAARTPA